MIDLAQRYKGIVFYNPAECRVLMDMRTCELIRKDLEILEILKKTLNNSFLWLIKNQEEQEKVKEWLDNE